MGRPFTVMSMHWTKWIIGPRYSHDFYPIDKGFANVWKFVRREEERAKVNPLSVLNEAFDYYSIGGEGGCQGKKKF